MWNEQFAKMQERDPETGLDPTLFRMYSSGQGRWLSPDPLGGDISNPQSLNRYAYVLNNPASFTDPLGLYAPPLGCDIDHIWSCPPGCDPFRSEEHTSELQ